MVKFLLITPTTIVEENQIIGGRFKKRNETVKTMHGMSRDDTVENDERRVSVRFLQAIRLCRKQRKIDQNAGD